ncbi:hypothetical protein M5K25_026601 [Dendrobium thyrsiflorum]|uniref:Uncharacterized protein n=1 Tax=Dendrobium thyrsiflorum TaxID=117978 RepID=A0ABD0TXS0_DENTH
MSAEVSFKELEQLYNSFEHDLLRDSTMGSDHFAKDNEQVFGMPASSDLLDFVLEQDSSSARQPLQFSIYELSSECITQKQVCNPEPNIPCVDGVDLSVGRALNADSGSHCVNGLDGNLFGVSSCRCVNLHNVSAQKLHVTGQCTSAVCVNSSKILQLT